jgi:threonine dehydrogenase-like Zn-dependent dehydrogenase
LGQFAARLYRHAGAGVTGFDIAADRVESLQRAGIRAAVIECNLVTAAWVQQHSDFSVVVDVTGVPDVLRYCLDLMQVHEWGDEEPIKNRFVIQGSYPDDFSLPYQATFLRESQIILPRHRKLTDVDRVLHTMAAGLDLSDLAGEPFPARMASQMYENLGSRQRIGGSSSGVRILLVVNPKIRNHNKVVVCGLWPHPQVKST